MADIEDVLPFSGIFLKILLILGLTFAVIRVSRYILKRWFWPIVEKTETKADDRILHLFESLLLFFIILRGMQAIIKLLQESTELNIEFMDDVFYLLYWSIGVYVVFRFISIISNWYLSRIPLRDREEIDQRAVRTVKYMLMLIFAVLAVSVLLQHFDVSKAALTASFAAIGIGGIIVGLAAQSVLTDIITGMVIIIDRPFRIGDRIRIEKLDTWGDVIEIGWRSTRILTRDHRLVAIPNSVIGTDLITNYSIPDKIYRVDTEVVVSYGPDIEYVRNLIIEALKREEWIMHDKPIEALLV